MLLDCRDADCVSAQSMATHQIRARRPIRANKAVGEERRGFRGWRRKNAGNGRGWGVGGCFPAGRKEQQQIKPTRGARLKRLVIPPHACKHSGALSLSRSLSLHFFRFISSLLTKTLRLTNSSNDAPTRPQSKSSDKINE